jgi:hypothetical protein
VSRVSNFIASCVERSNIFITCIIFLVVICVLPMRGQDDLEFMKTHISDENLFWVFWCWRSCHFVFLERSNHSYFGLSSFFLVFLCMILRPCLLALLRSIQALEIGIGTNWLPDQPSHALWSTLTIKHLWARPAGKCRSIRPFLASYSHCALP